MPIPVFLTIGPRKYFVRAVLMGSAFVTVAALPVWAQAPTGLTVKTATGKRVDLSWSGVAGSYTVQRRVLGGTFGNVATATTTSFSDTTIDAYTTYQYQILNGTAASGPVTAGPPPSGVTNVAPAPVAGNTPSQSYGFNASLALDGNGDPAFIFIWDDPNGDGDHSDTQLLFRSWNRAHYAWNPVVKIAAVGDVANSSKVVTSLAYDSSTNTFAAASEAASSSDSFLNLFVSADGGTTWTLKNSFKSSETTAIGPSVALRQGNIYMAYEIDTVGLTYVTGQLNQNPSTWTSKKPPLYPGTDLALWFGAPSLALDSAGNPAIAYWALPSTGDNGTLLYWKPAGGAAPIKITDSQANGNGTHVKVVFNNLNPRVVMWVVRNDGDFGDGVHFAHSEDGGLSWAPTVLVPPDGNSTSDYPFDIAVDSKSTVAVAFGQNSNSGDDSHKCGNPKLSISTDLTHFTTCSFASKDVTGNFSVFPGGLQVAYGGNDKLYVLWMESSDTQANTGILMYREPPAGAATAPNISQVVNGATFADGTVSGSWVTIKGVNLSDQTRTWQGADFNGNVLPTNLSGVQVKINGLNAPVYFISPTQVNVQAPSSISGSVPVQVIDNGVASNTLTVTVAQNAPGLFTYQLGGKTFPSALYNNTTTIVGDPALFPQAAKAKAGDIIQLYGTSLGPSPAGNIVDSVIVFSNPVTVSLGSTNVAASFAGLVGVGLFQINFTVPSLPDGEYPLTISTLGKTSQAGVIIPITH